MIARHYVIAHVMDVMLFWEFHILIDKHVGKLTRKYGMIFPSSKRLCFQFLFFIFFVEVSYFVYIIGERAK